MLNKPTLTALLMAALTITSFAGRPSGGGGGGGGFDFTYDVGTTATNYHAYALVCQAGFVSPQPANTVTLVNWWVTDLGPVTGTGTVTVPAPLTIKGQAQSLQGLVMFADADDLGGQRNIFPIPRVALFTSKYYNGDLSIDVITPLDSDADDSGISIYFAAPFSPLSWDLSPYVWNVEPSTW